MKKKKVKEIGITALYERLSRDDDGDGDSNSIVHQKQMLETYAKEHGFINLHHYTDDGWSGASFDRPAWNELVSGVKDGKITTVIVKDLSRVGRDHLQVGFFTDILFREKEVRFIAVGNSIDSNDQQSNEFAPFLNIMNEWYVRDTSKKIKAVLKSRGMSGKAHTSNSPCYGYVKDPENPDHWVVDEEAAAIVRRIFQMSIDGKGPYEIARCLAESKVERPSYYLAKKGIGNHQSDCDYNNPYMWRGNTVASILDRLEYTGCTVNFRTYKKSYKEKKSQKADKADWVIFEGTQEPIIDKETWNIVQGLRKNVRRADSLGEANPLTGKVICGECGSVMYNHRRKNGRIRVYYTPKGERRESFSKPEDCYSCSQNALGRQKYQKVCSCHAIRTSALRKIALECIRRTCAYVNNNQEEFLNLYNQISESQSRTRLEELKSRISKAERRAYARLDSGFKQFLDFVQNDPTAARMLVASENQELLKQLLRLITQSESRESLQQSLESLENSSLDCLSDTLNIEKLKRVAQLMESNMDNCSEEFWQSTVFKENQWVLAQIFSTPCTIYEDKAYVGGKSMSNRDGNVCDFIYQNELSQNIALIEIKTPCTPIIGNSYRATYSFSSEMSGAINQVLNYKDSLTKEFYSLQSKSSPRFEVFNPKCVVIIGRISAMEVDEVAAFERFRNSLNNVTVVTFDELYTRITGLITMLSNKQSE